MFVRCDIILREDLLLFQPFCNEERLTSIKGFCAESEKTYDIINNELKNRKRKLQRIVTIMGQT